MRAYHAKNGPVPAAVLKQLEKSDFGIRRPTSIEYFAPKTTSFYDSLACRVELPSC